MVTSHKLKLILLVTMRPVAHLGGHPCISIGSVTSHVDTGQVLGAAIKCKFIHGRSP